MTAEMLVKSISRARLSDQVVLLCDKELGRWSVAEKTNFDHELESAIDFLSQLTPVDSADRDPPGDADSERRLQLARERRDQLIREEKWIDAPTVHVQQGGRGRLSGHQQHCKQTAPRWGVARSLEWS